MKQLILVRHAKAVPYGYSDDFNRELTERGENDAITIGSRLKEQKFVPGTIISSPAKRALQTAHLFARTLNFPENKIRIEEDLYEGMTTNDFITLLHELPEEASTVFVFGHNPTVFYLVSNLVKFFNGDMPTCSTVGISFSVDKWDEIEARRGQIDFHFAPRMFK